MKPFIKASLIAMGATTVFFGADGILTAINRRSGRDEPAELAKGVVVCVIVYFAIRIAYKSDDQLPEEDQSD